MGSGITIWSDWTLSLPFVLRMRLSHESTKGWYLSKWGKSMGLY